MISFEKFLIVNFSMDLLAIALVARSRGRILWKRVFIAALIGTVYATLAQLRSFSFLTLLPCQAFLALILSSVAVSNRSIRDIPIGAVCILCAMAFLGGYWHMLSFIPGGSILAVPIGAAAIVVFSQVRNRKLMTWEVSILIRDCGAQARFMALVDTGNRLREPLSDLPVMIAESDLLSQVLPQDFDFDSDILPEGFRQVGFGALGARGRLDCFMPKELYVDTGQGYRLVRDVWIAVYPGKIPGKVRALAPPSLGMVEY